MSRPLGGSTGRSPKGAVYVLMGERGIGKSVICGRVAERAQRLGYRVAGLVTERSDDKAFLAEGWHSGLANTGPRVVVDLSNGRRFLFGWRTSTAGASEDLCVEASDRKSLPGWQLETDALARGNEILAAATPCDLLIIDELGPLEVNSGQGWTEAFRVLGSRSYEIALVTCRSWLLDRLVLRMGPVVPRMLDATRESRDALPDAIIDILRRAKPTHGRARLERRR